MTHDTAPDPITIDQTDGEGVSLDILSTLGLSPDLTVPSEVVYQFNRLTVLALALGEEVPQPKFLGAVALFDQDNRNLNNDQALDLARDFERAEEEIDYEYVPTLALSRYAVSAGVTPAPEASGIFFEVTDPDHGHVRVVIPSEGVFRAEINGEDPITAHTWEAEVVEGSGVLVRSQFQVPNYIVAPGSSEESVAMAARGFLNKGTQGGVLAVGESSIYALRKAIMNSSADREDMLRQAVVHRVFDHMRKHDFDFPGVDL